VRRQALSPGGARGALGAGPSGGTPTWYDGEGDDERRGRRTTIGDDGRRRQQRWTSGARSRQGRDHDVDRRDGDYCRRMPRRTIIEPFPTLYWLTSPALRSRVSAIEGSGSNCASAMEKRLRSSPRDAIGMERAHASYGAERWALLTDEDREEANRRGWRGALDDTRGVAGIASSTRRRRRVVAPGGGWDGRDVVDDDERQRRHDDNETTTREEEEGGGVLPR
jgi:hypothetical protein